MKPREFWIWGSIVSDKPINFSEIHKQGYSASQIHAREVVPIDWEKVWQEYAMRGECGIFNDDEKIIEDLVEKQLKGEE